MPWYVALGVGYGVVLNGDGAAFALFNLAVFLLDGDKPFPHDELNELLQVEGIQSNISGPIPVASLV
jgi:hypothetical protein